jgi:hypothetical protein
MIDIGVAYYRIKAVNEIDAIWYTSRQDKREIGTGIAKGDTSKGFPGNYKITYFNPDGSESGTYDLKIDKTGSIYDLSYHKDGELFFVGVGIETSDGMAAGWRKTEQGIRREGFGVTPSGQ